MADKSSYQAYDSATAAALLEKFQDLLDGTFARVVAAVLRTLISGEDQTANRLLVEQRNNYAYISTATTTVVKNAAGFLHTLTVEGGTAGTIIVYDNASGVGTIIGSFDATNALNSYRFDVSFANGLTIITSAATKISVAYR